MTVTIQSEKKCSTLGLKSQKKITELTFRASLSRVKEHDR